MYIAIDFDGTVVKHMYPDVGDDNPGAEETLKNLVKKGHKLILFTMRSNKQLDDAVNWFSVKGIPLYGINHNPSQSHWTTSPKVFAQIYIDDAALGCPLKAGSLTELPYVDWEKVNNLLKDLHVL